MEEYIIENLFPTPVYMTETGKEFTKKETDFIWEQEKSSIKNRLGNYYSKDTFILEKPELKNIKKFVEKHCNNYLEKIICTSDDLKLQITQSWLNYTYENQRHDIHYHPNSVLSGVLYFNADEKNDKIKLINPLPVDQLSPEIKQFNIWNSDSWWFPVKTNQLIIFPSSIFHQVDMKQGSNTRISLAFNTFYKGTIGSSKHLKQLKI